MVGRKRAGLNVAALSIALVGCVTLLGCGGQSEPDAVESSRVPSSDSATVTTEEPTTTVAASLPSDDDFVVAGTGQQVVELPEGNQRVVVHATADGEGLFALNALDSEGDYVEDLAFSPPGTPYDGLQLIVTPIDEVVAIEVKAKGDWTLELLQSDQVPVVEDEFAGTGDSVVQYDGAGGEATVASDGRGRFSVQAEDGRYVVPETNGPYAGTETVQSGPVLIEVRSQGSWTVSIDSSANPTGSTVPAGTTVDAATGALADECLQSWVVAQRLGPQGRFTEDERRAALQPMFESCQAAADAVEPLALRSPLRSPVQVLHNVLYEVLMLASFELGAGQPCSPDCVLTPSTQETYLQLTPDRHDVPAPLYGYLGDDPSAPTIGVVIPGLLVGG